MFVFLVQFCHACLLYCNFKGLFSLTQSTVSGLVVYISPGCFFVISGNPSLGALKKITCLWEGRVQTRVEVKQHMYAAD